MRLGPTLCLILLLLIPNLIQAQEKEKLSFKAQFIDTLDNAFDVSRWLANLYGVLPFASLITEPAVDYGLAGGLLWINPNVEDMKKGIRTPPDIAALAGLYTLNNTWALALTYKGHYKEDHIRFEGTLAYSSLNLAVYRDGPISGDQEFKFNMEGFLFSPALLFRIKNSRSFLGGSYVFYRSNTTFELDKIPNSIDSTRLSSTLSGLGIEYQFDSRDNTFTTNSGMLADVQLLYYDDFLGSDFTYTRLDAYWTGFYSKINKLTMGLRVDYRAVFQDPPFFALPYVQLRGIPIFRYQGENVVVVETEERWDLLRRWSLVGFAGLGKGFKDLDSFGESLTAWSLGGGFRYFLSRQFNIYAGADIARGPEQWAFYIQFGHYWNGL